MRALFALTLVFMALASVFMARWSAGTRDSKRAPLVWTSDPNPLRDEQVALFNRLNTDIELQLDPANQGMDKVIVQSIGGVGPDLFDCRDANQLSAYVRSGIALDVTDELLEMGVDVKKDAWRAMQAMAVYEGRVYGVPTNIAGYALWFNEEILARERVTLPRGTWHWDQLIPIAQKLTHRDSNGKILQAGLLFDWWNWVHFVYGFGGRLFSPNGTRCLLDSAEVIRAVQLMQDLVYKYKVTPSPVEEAGMAAQGGWGADNINVFGSERAALAVGGRWWLANLRQLTGLKLGVAESPTGGVRAFGTVGRATLVNAKGPNRKGALRFLAYLASKEYNELINTQADGICPFRKYAQGDAFLHDPKHPEESYNDVWRTASEFSVPTETSPFINGQLAARIIDKQIDLVRIGQKKAEVAMRDATRQVNAEIDKTLRNYPELRKRYEDLVRRGAP